MKITHNHRIVSLYFTIFILVSLNTVYLPVWLNEVINLNTQQIGLLIGSVGFLKIFSNFLITKNIKTFRAKRLVTALLTFFIFCSFIFIALQKNMDVTLTTFLSFFILLIFAPLLPIIENINTGEMFMQFLIMLLQSLTYLLLTYYIFDLKSIINKLK